MPEETNPDPTLGAVAEGPMALTGRGLAGGRPSSRSSGSGSFRRGKFWGGRDARPRKACRFCVERKDALDYKDLALLRSLTTDRGKILSGRTTGTCAWHQRKVRVAIKRARQVALIPFSS